MSDAQLRDEVMTLFLAGHETTAIALSWACYLIAQDPDIETKLAAELQAVLGDRVPAPEDLPRLRYTEMVLKEAMRLYPAVWGTAGYSGGVRAWGIPVPAGSNIFHSAVAHATRSAIFPRAGTIRPERWRDDPVRSGKIPRFAYFPFGGGPRVCVGAAFAMMEATLLLAMIQQKISSRSCPRTSHRNLRVGYAASQTWHSRDPAAPDGRHKITFRLSPQILR